MSWKSAGHIHEVHAPVRPGRHGIRAEAETRDLRPTGSGIAAPWHAFPCCGIPQDGEVRQGSRRSSQAWCQVHCVGKLNPVSSLLVQPRGHTHESAHVCGPGCKFCAVRSSCQSLQKKQERRPPLWARHVHLLGSEQRACQMKFPGSAWARNPSILLELDAG